MSKILEDWRLSKPPKFNRPFPFSKHIYTCKRFALNKVILPLYNPKTGIRTICHNVLQLCVTRPILLRGFGIFGTTTERYLPVRFGVYIKDYCEENILVEANNFVYFNGHRNIYQLLFKTPLYLNCYEKYNIYVDVDSYLTYCGVMGQNRVLCDQVTIMFLNVDDCFRITNVESGNFPEIYFSIAREDTEECKLHKILPIEYKEENKRQKKLRYCRLPKKPEKKESRPYQKKFTEPTPSNILVDNEDAEVPVDADYG